MKRNEEAKVHCESKKVGYRTMITYSNLLCRRVRYDVLDFVLRCVDVQELEEFFRLDSVKEQLIVLYTSNNTQHIGVTTKSVILT